MNMWEKRWKDKDEGTSANLGADGKPATETSLPT